MFYERYLELCREAGITPSAAAMEIGFSKTLVSRWKRGGGCTDATLDKVSNYFGVSLEWLKGETDEKTKAAPTDGDGFDIDDFVDGITDRDVLLDLIQRATQKLREVDSATE